jgi:hypothetical protein
MNGTPFFGDISRPGVNGFMDIAINCELPLQASCVRDFVPPTLQCGELALTH